MGLLRTDHGQKWTRISAPAFGDDVHSRRHVLAMFELLYGQGCIGAFLPIMDQAVLD